MIPLETVREADGWCFVWRHIDIFIDIYIYIHIHIA